MEAMPPPPSQPPQHQALPPSHHNPELLPLPERQMYDQLFREAGATSLDGFVHGRPAVEVMSRSGLPKPALRQIWALCDPKSRGVLYRPHFHLAMRLMALAQNAYIAPDDPTLVGRIRAKDPLSVTLPQLPPLRMAPAPASAPANPTIVAWTSAMAMQTPSRPSMQTPSRPLTLSPAAPVLATLPPATMMPSSPPSFEAAPQTVAGPMPVLPVPVMTLTSSMSAFTSNPVVLSAGSSDDIASRMAALDAVVEDHEWDDFQEAEPAAPTPPPFSAASAPTVVSPPSDPVASTSGPALLPFSFSPTPPATAPLPSFSASLPPAPPLLPIPIMGLEAAWMTAPAAAPANSSKASSILPSLLDGDMDPSHFQPSFSSASQASVMSSFSYMPPSSPHDPFGGPQLVSNINSYQATHVPTSRFMTESPPSSPPLLPLSDAIDNDDGGMPSMSNNYSLPSLGATLSLTGASQPSLYEMSPYAENRYADPDASPQASPSTPPAPSNSSPTPATTTMAFGDLDLAAGKGAMATAAYVTSAASAAAAAPSSPKGLDFEALKASSSLSSSARSPSARSPFSPPPPSFPLPLPLPPSHKALSMANPFQVQEEVVTGAASFSFLTTSFLTVAHTAAAPSSSSSSSLSPPLPTGGLITTFMTTTTTTTTSTNSSSSTSVVAAHVPQEVKEEEEDWAEYQGGDNGGVEVGSASAEFVRVLPRQQTGDEEMDPFAGLKEDDEVEEHPVRPLAAEGDKRSSPSPIQLEESPPASSSSSGSSSSKPSSPSSSSSLPVSTEEEEKKKETEHDEWGEFAESGSLPQIAVKPTPTTPADIAVALSAVAPSMPSNPTWAQPNPWQDLNPWDTLPTQPLTLQTTGGGSALTDAPEAVTTASPHFLISSLSLASSVAPSSASILLSPTARFAVKDEQFNEREMEKSSQSQLAGHHSITTTTTTTSSSSSSSSTQLSLEGLLGKLWEREMLNEAAALTDHLEAMATLPEEKARYEEAKAEDQLEKAIDLRVKVKEMEDKICDEAKMQAWRKAVATVDDGKMEGGETGVMVTLAGLQARVAVVDAGRGEVFAAAFLRDHPSLAKQAASGLEGRREAVRRARRARRCCALLEGMDEGGALAAYPEHWLTVLAAAQSHVGQAVEACKHVLLATEEGGAVRKEVVTSMKLLSLVEAALEMVRVARLVLASAADALLGLMLAEKEGLEACVEELRAVLGQMGLGEHFASLFPPTSEVMGLLVADCAEAGALEIDSRQVCSLSMAPLKCARGLGMSVTYFSGHAYFCACVNLWLNAVSREAPQPQPQVQRKGGEAKEENALF